MNTTQWKEALTAGKMDQALEALYGKEALAAQRDRYAAAADAFASLYGEREINFFSVPGRSEISGNHTDHNHGRVIAAAIDLDIIAVVSPRADGTVRVKSEGFPEDVISLEDLQPKESAFGSSASLIAGVCAGFAERGLKIGGFDAYTTNAVYKGSGLSSSAAFEDMIGNILNHLYNEGKVSAPDIAKLGQYAENVYFGKPSGLMDQTACAVGSFVTIDFADPTAPIIEQLNVDLDALGYRLCITNTGGNHADLTPDYAAVPAEMKKVAAHFGQSVLRGLTAPQIIEQAASLRAELGDRALLRALHFIAENDRVAAQAQALREGRFDEFLDGVLASGRSSFMYLQNVYTTQNVTEQGLSLALAISEQTLAGCRRKAAWRVHGGGFAGTIQAFVPAEDVDRYRAVMDQVFGEGACRALRVRQAGALRVG